MTSSELNIKPTDYKRVIDNRADFNARFIVYKPNTNKGWLLLAHLLLKHTYWN